MRIFSFEETAERELAEENRIKLAELHERDRMKTEFMSVMSHELRTPITPIKGYLSLLLGGGMGEITPKQREAPLAVQKQGEHLLTIIDSVLDVSRIESGKFLEISKVPVSMNEAIVENVEGLKEQIKEKNLELDLDLAKNLPTIMGDEAKLVRVVANILGNALKFTPKGGRIVIRTVPQDDSVQVSIEDSGVGIAAENLEKVFEKFYQVDSSYTRAAGGIGMGLTIAREIVEAHGGRIWAESEGLGKGAKLSFTLPVSG
jgi:two-component system CheB/CheR fusion protein